MYDGKKIMEEINSFGFEMTEEKTVLELFYISSKVRLGTRNESD